MARTRSRLDRSTAPRGRGGTRRIAVVVWSALISVLIGTSAMPSEAATHAAEYVPELCLSFSNPSPRPGDRLIVDGCAEPAASVAVTLDGSSLGRTVAADSGVFRLTITIPELEPGSYPLVVTAGGDELGSLTVEVAADEVAGSAEEGDADPNGSDTDAPPAESPSDDDDVPPEQLALSEDEGLAAFWSNVRRFLIVIGAVAVLFGFINRVEANRSRSDTGR